MVIPFPDQVPPGSTAESVTGASFSQKGPAAVIVASQAVGLQAGSPLTENITRESPNESTTLIVSTPGGGVIVVPVPKLDHVRTDGPGSVKVNKPAQLPKPGTHVDCILPWYHV